MFQYDPILSTTPTVTLPVINIKGDKKTLFKFVCQIADNAKNKVSLSDDYNDENCQILML